jgi:hypothetical protein
MTVASRQAIAVGLAICIAVVATVARAAGPCDQITAACEKAGFVSGGGREGAGLVVHCLEPLMQQKPQPRNASKPLPRVDPQLITACAAARPAFGKARTLATETDAGPAEGAQPAPASPASTSAPAARAPGQQPNNGR